MGRHVVVARVLSLLLVLVSLACCREAEPPSRAEVLKVIAAAEQVDATHVQLLALETAKDTTAVLYRLVPPATPQSRLGPLQMRVLVHPLFRPGSWTLGGGSPAEEPAPGCAATLSLTSSSGDTGCEINAVIYGVTGPAADTVEATVRGKRYRTSAQHGGYIFLLEDQAVQYIDIESMHVYDARGAALPIPCVPTPLFGGQSGS